MPFGKRKQPPIRSLIGEGTTVRGELRFHDGLRIDGEVLGDVVATGEARNMLVISEKARIQGRVFAGHVIINGQVDGPVHSSELLELQPKARIDGEVRYEVLEMHPGAVISGDLRPIQAGDRPATLIKLAQASAPGRPAVELPAAAPHLNLKESSR